MDYNKKVEELYKKLKELDRNYKSEPKTQKIKTRKIKSKKLCEINKELNLIMNKISDLDIEINKYVTNNIDTDDFVDV
jgi:predicted transcriptional regulator